MCLKNAVNVDNLHHLELEMHKLLQCGIVLHPRGLVEHLRPHSVFRDDDVSGVAKNHDAPVVTKHHPVANQPMGEQTSRVWNKQKLNVYENVVEMFKVGEKDNQKNHQRCC